MRAPRSDKEAIVVLGKEEEGKNQDRRSHMSAKLHGRLGQGLPKDTDTGCQRMASQGYG